MSDILKDWEIISIDLKDIRDKTTGEIICTFNPPYNWYNKEKMENFEISSIGKGFRLRRN